MKKKILLILFTVLLLTGLVTKSASALVEPDNKVGSTYVSYKVTTIKNWTILKPTFKVTNYGKGNVNIHIYNKDGSIYTSLIGLKPGRSHNFGLPRKHTTYCVSVTAPNNLMGYKIDVDNEVEMPTIKKARRQYSNSVGKIIEQDYDQNLKKILEKIVEIEGGIYNPIFAIQLMINCTGMRVNEVIALKPNKLNYTNNTLLIDRSISWHPNKSKKKKIFRRDFNENRWRKNYTNSRCIS